MLFPSTLFISTSDIDLTPYLSKLGHSQIINNPDIFCISSPDDYKIENVRQIKIFLSRQPYNHNTKIIIITNAHLLNTESQNALLKSLEEPSENNYFILITPVISGLLPTIISRCHIIRLKSSPKKLKAKLLKFPASVSDSLSLADTLVRDRETTLQYIEDQLILFQQQLIDNPDTQTVKIIDKLIKCHQMLTSNVDPRACLDLLLLP